MLHILLVTVENPLDPLSWSGTPYNMLKSLERNFYRVSVLSSPVSRKSYFDSFLRLVFGREKYPIWMTNYALQAYARRLESTVAEVSPDVVLCISSQHLIFAKKLDIPVYMISDAPWFSYKEAYRNYELLPMHARKYADQEAAAARKITAVIYPTPWACNEAKLQFGLPDKQIKLLPFGANSFCNDTTEQVLININSKTLTSLNFLFVGKDWERKGGPLAIEIVNKLNSTGYASTMHIVGCSPALSEESMLHVCNHGYLSPSSEADRLTLANTFRQADFFLVPSHAECFGLVFAEAQSYGLVCLSLNSFGIPGVVVNAETGLLFDPNVQAETVVSAILKLRIEKESYRKMAIAAREKFSTELNWMNFGKKIFEFVSS